MRYETRIPIRFDWRRGVSGLCTMVALTGCPGADSTPPFSFWLAAGVVVADFNSDGRADVAVTQTYMAGPPPHPGYVTVYLQNAEGAFDAPVQHAIRPHSWGLSAGHFDGDGKLDLVAATPNTAPIQPNVANNSGGISILRQDPAHPGSFLPSQWVFTGGMASDAAIAQLTTDGFADVVVADSVLVNGRALLLEQSSASPGTLLPPVALPAGKASEDVAVADVNGDGLTDIVLAAYDSVAVFYQRAGGGFDPVVILPAGLSAQGVAVGDLDGDGRADIVVANAGNAPAGGLGGASVTVLRQTSLGSFIVSSIPVADGARRVSISDLNADSVPDLAVISLVYQAQAPSRVSVLLQSTAIRGQFAVTAVFNGTFTGNFIAAGDVNGDGRNDIVINEGPSVFLQSLTAPGTFEPMRPLR
jgi:hypothetical protein